MLQYMKQILIELDDRCVRDLEKVAPTKERKRAEFIRFAIRRALDLALERNTQLAYERSPLDSSVLVDDLAGWDVNNELAASAKPRRKKTQKPKAAA